jgi:putative transposase
VKVFAQDESRLGLLPIGRRRITAGGVPPIATITHTFDYFYLYGAVEPTTGASFFLALPGLNTALFQLWLDHFAQAFPDSFTLLVLDHGAFHKAKALQWPANVAPVFLPPYSPELNPIERLWRDLKDQWADGVAKTLDDLSEAVGTIIQRYSPATLQSLTGFAYFVPAVDTAGKSENG